MPALINMNNEKSISQHEGPLITVITPFCNEGRYLREAIESVLKQTYQHWEYLLVDDGSTDESTAIAKEYSSEFPDKIFYLEHAGHANKGVCAARNLAIEKANGTYIAFLDGDDFWLPDKLRLQVNLIAEFPNAGMFCEGTYYMNKGRNPKIENVNVLVGVEPDKLYAPPSLLIALYPLGSGDAPCMNAILVNTALARKIGGFEESFAGRFSLFEDQAFLFKIYFHTEVYVSSLCNNIYRQRADSSMHKLLNAGKYTESRKFFFTWLKKYLAKQTIHYKKVNALFRKSVISNNYPFLYKFTYGINDKFKAVLNKVR